MIGKHPPFAPSQVCIGPEHADESGALLVLPLPPLLQPLQLRAALFELPTQREDLAFQLSRRRESSDQTTQLKRVTAEDATPSLYYIRQKRQTGVTEGEVLDFPSSFTTYQIRIRKEFLLVPDTRKMNGQTHKIHLSNNHSKQNPCT